MILESDKNFIVLINSKLAYTEFFKKAGLIHHHFRSNDYYVDVFFDSQCLFWLDPSYNCFILSKGQILGSYSNKELLFKRYLQIEERIFNDLEGTYSLIIGDLSKQKVIAGTDILNSNKLFYGSLMDSHFISSTIYYTPNHEYTIRIGAIYNYLIQGAILNNYTLFNEIYTIAQSSYIRFYKKNISHTTYWEPSFSPSNNYFNINESAAHLKSLLFDSIEKRFRNDDNIYISLSGGYDVSFLLGILCELGFKDRLKAFSYYVDNITEGSDCDIARRQSKLLGVEFTAINSYNTNLREVIEQNALRGEGIAPFVNEIDFWSQFNDVVEPGIGSIVTGEEFFGMKVMNHRNRKNAYYSLGFKDISNISIWKEQIPNSFWNLLEETSKMELATILNSVSTYNSLFDYKSLLYFKIAIPNIMMPWREFYAGRKLKLQYPLLDRNIIEFILELPIDQRLNKSIFKKVAKDMYPEIFEIPRARVSNSVPHWSNILNKNSGVLVDMLSEYSTIDHLISPEFLIKLSKENKNRLKNKYVAYNNIISKTSLKISSLEKFHGTLLPKAQVRSDELIIRSLLVREFVKIFNQRQIKSRG